MAGAFFYSIMCTRNARHARAREEEEIYRVFADFFKINLEVQKKSLPLRPLSETGGLKKLFHIV